MCKHVWKHTCVHVKHEVAWGQWGGMAFTMSEGDVMNCTISHEIHQYLFSSVYILVLLVSMCTCQILYEGADLMEWDIWLFPNVGQCDRLSSHISTSKKPGSSLIIYFSTHPHRASSANVCYLQHDSLFYVASSGVMFVVLLFLHAFCRLLHQIVYSFKLWGVVVWEADRHESYFPCRRQELVFCQRHVINVYYFSMRNHNHSLTSIKSFCTLTQYFHILFAQTMIFTFSQTWHVLFSSP